MEKQWSQEKLDQAYSFVQQIKAADRIFKRASIQITLMDEKIEAAKTRFSRNAFNDCPSYGWMNRIKITSLVEIRNHFYDYAITKSDIIKDLQTQLKQLTGYVYHFDQDEAESPPGAEHTA